MRDRAAGREVHYQGETVTNSDQLDDQDSAQSSSGKRYLGTQIDSTSSA
jgi:hypothetical protein